MAYEPNEAIYKQIKEICLQAYDAKRTDPYQLLQEAWSIPGFPMHCPEHHVLAPSVLLTCYRTAKDDPKTQLEDDLNIADERGRNLLGGFCGYYGACGAGIGAGIFFSLFTDTTPMSTITWGLGNELTARCLEKIGAAGGPRCCKRVSFITIDVTLQFMKEKLNLDIKAETAITCRYYDNNNECLSSACSYYPGEE